MTASAPEAATAKLDLARLINVPMTTEFTLDEPPLTFGDEVMTAPIERLEELAILGAADIREQHYNVRNARIEGRKTLLRLFPRTDHSLTPSGSQHEFLTLVGAWVSRFPRVQP